MQGIASWWDYLPYIVMTFGLWFIIGQIPAAFLGFMFSKWGLKWTIDDQIKASMLGPLGFILVFFFVSCITLDWIIKSICGKSRDFILFRGDR